MTVSVDADLRIREYAGDDSANPRAVPFRFLDNDALKVTRTNADGSETVLVRGTHYSVAGAGNLAGGSVTPLSPIAAGTSWRIEGDMSLEQPTDYTAGDDFPAESHERGLDRAMIAHQEARRDLNDNQTRSWLVPRGELAGVLAPAAQRAGRFRAWDAEGNEYAASGTGADGALRVDLADDDGVDLIGFRVPYALATTRSLKSKLLERVSVKDFGAVGDGVVDDTASIQAAIDSGVKEIYFPPGEYRHGNLNFNVLYQRAQGAGALLVRMSAVTTITVSARGVEFHGLRFSGGGFAGNNITVTAPEVRFLFCNSMETLGRALKSQDSGGGMFILGGTYNTLDHTAAGYEIELADAVPGTSLYTKLIGVDTQQSFGGVLIAGNGTVRVADCQIGKLTVTNGGGMFDNNRFNGAVSVQSSTNQFDNNAFAENITFGDGAGGNIGGILFGPTNVVQSFKTVTVNTDIVESLFFFSQLANVTLTILGHNNDIYHGRIAYAGVLAASGGAPAVGDGALATFYSRAGREIIVDFELFGGPSTNFGTGQFWVTAPFNSSRNALGGAIAVEDGNRSFVAIAQVQGGDNKIFIQLADTTGAQNAGATYPFVWGANDFIRAQITISYSP